MDLHLTAEQSKGAVNEEDHEVVSKKCHYLDILALCRSSPSRLADSGSRSATVFLEINSDFSN